MSWIPTDDEKGEGGAPQDDQELGTAPTMLYMKPVSEDEAARAVIDKAAEDMGGETLMMMPAVSGMSAADALSEDGAPAQGPAAGPLPAQEGLEELDSAKTMMYMPAVGDPSDPTSGEATPGGFSDEVQKKLAALRSSIDAGGDDAGSSTMAYMPAVGGLPMDQSVDRMLAETGEAPIQTAPAAPRVPTAPAFPAVADPVKDLGEAATAASGPGTPPTGKPALAARPVPAFKPGPDQDDDDDEDLENFTGKKRGGKIFLILFLLLLLGVGGVFVAMLFDWVARPEFLEALPHYELNL